jgi:hypothetical protein
LSLAYDRVMHLSQHNLARWATIVAMIGMMVWPSFGQVLCMDDDGHFAIEATHPAAGCVDDAAPGAARDRDTTLEISQRDCRDFTLGVPPIVRPEQDRVYDLVTELALAPVLFVMDVDALVFVRPWHANHPVDCPARMQQLRVVCTTVLRI